MLTAHVERYVSLRQTLGFRFRDAARHLRAFAEFAAAAGDTHIRASTVVAESEPRRTVIPTQGGH